MIACTDCKGKKPLDELVRKYTPKDLGLYLCRDCLTEAQEGAFYPPIMPLRVNPTLEQQNRLKSLVKWALG